MSMSETLRLFRTFHDLQGKDLAAKLEISPSFLSEVEHGHKEATLDLLRRYSAIFDVPVSSIFWMEENLAAARAGRVPTPKIPPKLRALIEMADHLRQ